MSPFKLIGDIMGIKQTSPKNLSQLMPLNEWRTKRFTTPPSAETVRRWAVNGDIPVKKIGGNWYVDLALELNDSGDDLVEAVLRG